MKNDLVIGGAGYVGTHLVESLIEKNYKLSEDYLSQAIALDPDYVLAYENLARLKFETNNKIDYANYLKKIQAIQQRQKKL